MAYLPKYLKIVQLLQRRFSNGELSPGDVLPGEIALAQELGISRRTLRNALQVLEDDGFIIRKKGVGSILAPWDMHRRRRRSDVAIVYMAAPDAAHNYDFLLHRTHLADGIIRNIAGKGHWLRIVPLGEENPYFTGEELFLKGIDGFIFPGVQSKLLNTLEEVIKRKLPHIVFDAALTLPGCNVVTADDYQAGYDMVKMLLSEGVEKFAFAGGLLKSPLRNTANRRRFEGAKQAMLDAGKNIDPRFFQIVDKLEDDQTTAQQQLDAAELIRGMLKQKDMPRTVVLSSLLVADVFVSEVKKMGAERLRDFRMLTFRGSSPWNSVNELSLVAAMEYFSCDVSACVAKGTEMLDRWLNDPAYRAERVFVPCSYHPGDKHINLDLQGTRNDWFDQKSII